MLHICIYYLLVYSSFALPFFLDFKAWVSRNSICPLVLLNSSAAQISTSFNKAGLILNTKAFLSFSAILIVLLVYYTSFLNLGGTFPALLFYWN